MDNEQDNTFSPTSISNSNTTDNSQSFEGTEVDSLLFYESNTLEQLEYIISKIALKKKEKKKKVAKTKIARPKKERKGTGTEANTEENKSSEGEDEENSSDEDWGRAKRTSQLDNLPNYERQRKITKKRRYTEEYEEEEDEDSPADSSPDTKRMRTKRRSFPNLSTSERDEDGLWKKRSASPEQTPRKLLASHLMSYKSSQNTPSPSKFPSSNTPYYNSPTANKFDRSPYNYPFNNNNNMVNNYNYNSNSNSNSNSNNYNSGGFNNNYTNNNFNNNNNNFNNTNFNNNNNYNNYNNSNIDYNNRSNLNNNNNREYNNPYNNRIESNFSNFSDTQSRDSNYNNNSNYYNNNNINNNINNINNQRDSFSSSFSNSWEKQNSFSQNIGLSNNFNKNSDPFLNNNAKSILNDLSPGFRSSRISPIFDQTSPFDRNQSSRNNNANDNNNNNKIPSNNINNANDKNGVPKKEEKAQKSKAPIDKLEQERQKFKKFSAEYVIKLVNFFHHEQKLGDKEAFKHVCRKLNHFILDKQRKKNYVIQEDTKKQIVRVVDKFFMKNYKDHPRSVKLLEKAKEKGKIKKPHKEGERKEKRSTDPIVKENVDRKEGAEEKEENGKLNEVKEDQNEDATNIDPIPSSTL